MEGSLINRLQEVSDRYPDAVAVRHDESATAYGELWTRVRSVAGYFQECGLRPGDKVAIYIENSVSYIVLYYGALAAGGVVVAMNTAAKSRDILNWVRHCEARWLFVDESSPEAGQILSDSNPALQVIQVSTRPDKEADPVWSPVLAGGHDGGAITPSWGRDDPAAIIYTSGTTGQPKGVVLSHGNLAANTASIQQYLAISPDDRVLNVLPFYYSYGNSVLHTHLTAGAEIVLVNSMVYPKVVVAKMEESGVTGFSGVPSTYSLLLNRAKLEEANLGKLRYMTQAGGPMTPANIKKVRGILPHVDFYVMYGQTEATARLTYLEPRHLETKEGSVGRAIPGVTIEIRDKEGKSVASGVEGEIYATGENIMLGYLNNEAETAKVLRQGWLKTGDLGYADSDGFIYIKGRATDMIKSGANRISPKEIEEVIEELDYVEEVAVVGVPDEVLGEIIKAVIVLRPGQAPEKRDLQAHCKKNLAIYKIPKLIEFTDFIPKTASGKVQRHLLK